MASGPFIIPNKTKLNITQVIDTTNVRTLLNAANTFKLVLCTSALTPNDGDAGNEVYADISANELATGFGYTAGGLTLTSVAVTLASGVVKFTSANAVWTASGGSIPAWRHAYIYALGTFSAKVNPLVAHFLGDSTPADVPATTTGNTLTVTPSGSGIISYT
jgi:hypothetical protein